MRVLITGGTSGLGYAMAAALADGGARVDVTGRDDARSAEAAARLAGGQPKDDAGVVGFGMDVRDTDSIDRGAARRSPA